MKHQMRLLRAIPFTQIVASALGLAVAAPLVIEGWSILKGFFFGPPDSLPDPSGMLAVAVALYGLVLLTCGLALTFAALAASCRPRWGLIVLAVLCGVELFWESLLRYATHGMEWSQGAMAHAWGLLFCATFSIHASVRELSRRRLVPMSLPVPHAFPVISIAPGGLR